MERAHDEQVQPITHQHAVHPTAKHLSLWSNLTPNVCLTCPCIQPSRCNASSLPCRFHHGFFFPLRISSGLHSSDARLDSSVAELRKALCATNTYYILVEYEIISVGDFKDIDL